MRFTLCIAALGFVGRTSAHAFAGPQSTEFYYEGDLQNYSSELKHDVGFRLDENDVKASFYVKRNVRKLFAQVEWLRGRLGPGLIPKKFRPIVGEIEKYIDEVAPSDSAEKNGISNHHLAAKITQASFCFKTDPYAFAAMIWKESHFDQTRVSPTGAIGITQMTGAAIDEVNDQLGNRGIIATRMDNVAYWHSAIHCYTGGKPWVLMFGNKLNTLLRGETVTEKPGPLVKAKKWLLSDIDRQIIYGQIVLKVHLARARDEGQWGLDAYKAAFKNYNGDTKGGYNRKYSRSVVSELEKI